MSVIITDDTIEQIYKWIKECCDKNRMPGLTETIKVQFSNRLVTTWGRAWSNKIELSTLLWVSGSETDKKDTVIHETCHIIVKRKYGSESTIKSHGKEWQLCMKIAGLDPKATNSIVIEV